MHSKAKHIVCAFRLPGEEFYQLQSGADNREHGAACHILNLLEMNEIYHRVIFVARYYGGECLGPARFTAYGDATTSAIVRSSYNSVTKKNQAISITKWPRKDERSIQQTTTSPSGRPPMGRGLPSTSQRGSPTTSPIIKGRHSPYQRGNPNKSRILRNSNWASGICNLQQANYVS